MKLRITRKCWNELLMFSLSSREILFLGAGKRNTILHIERVKNCSRGGRHQAMWSDSCYYYAREQAEAKGLKILCEGHSHPTGLRHPSEVDVKGIPKGQIELIVFPSEKNIRAWTIKKTLKATLKSEVALIVVPTSSV